MASEDVSVRVDLERIRQNAAGIRARTGVELWATIKADAYGLGAARVAAVLAEVVDGFCVFSIGEAEEIGLWEMARRPIIAMGPPSTLDPRRFTEAHVRPTVSTVEQAAKLAAARPLLCVDTGMQRFACEAGEIDAILEAGGIVEAFTHATRLEHARKLCEMTAGRGLRLHAAASSLLEERAAWLDAVRPGLALYRGAVSVGARLVEARRSGGPIGYSGWANEGGHHGAILVGYASGLRAGPVVINGRRQRIMEVGMQSAYVTLGESDRVGDEVTLLGDGITEDDLAEAWGVSPHQALLAMARLK